MYPNEFTSALHEKIRNNPKGFVVVNKKAKNQVIYYPKNGSPVVDSINEQNIDNFLLSFLKLEGLKRTTCQLDENSGVVIVGGLEYIEDEYFLLEKAMKLAELSLEDETMSSILGIASPISKSTVDHKFRSAIIPLQEKSSSVSGPIFNQDMQIKKKVELSSSLHKTQPKKHKFEIMGGSALVAALAILVVVTMVIPDEELVSGDLLKAAELYSYGQYDLALREYNGILDKNPISIPALNGKGNSLISLKQYDEALEIFDRIIEIDPQNRASQIGKHKTLIAMGSYFEAIKHIESTFSGSSTYLENQKKLLLALINYEEVLQNNPDDVIALTGMGDIYDQLSLYEQAKDQFDEALQINPNYVKADVGACNVLFHQFNLREANICYNKILKSSPNEINALVGKGNTLSAQKDYGLAIRIFEQAHALDSDHLHPLLGWANTLISAGKFSEAEEKINEILDKSSNSYLTKLLGGNMYAMQGKLDQAILQYEEILDEDPWNVTVLIAKGDVLIKKGEYEQAILLFDKVLDLEPSNQAAINGLLTARSLL